MKITIEVSDTFTIESRRGAQAFLETKDIAEAMLPKLFDNGLMQKVRDTASQAAKLALIDHFGESNVPDGPITSDHKAWLKTPEGNEIAKGHELKLMMSAIKTLKDGTWSMRTSGVTRDDRTAAIVNVFAAMLESADRKRFNKLSFKEKLDAANANEIDEELIESEVNRLVEAREAKAAREASVAKLGKKVKITF